MDMDTKLVLQMWRVQVMVIDHMQSREAGLLRRIAELEKELEDTHVDQRFSNSGPAADWRRVGRGRRRSPDSSD